MRFPTAFVAGFCAGVALVWRLFRDRTTDRQEESAPRRLPDPQRVAIAVPPSGARNWRELLKMHFFAPGAPLSLASLIASLTMPLWCGHAGNFDRVPRMERLAIVVEEGSRAPDTGEGTPPVELLPIFPDRSIGNHERALEIRQRTPENEAIAVLPVEDLDHQVDSRRIELADTGATLKILPKAVDAEELPQPPRVETPQGTGGMAPTLSRVLTLTAKQHDIESQEQYLGEQKLRLSQLLSRLLYAQLGQPLNPNSPAAQRLETAQQLIQEKESRIDVVLKHLQSQKEATIQTIQGLERIAQRDVAVFGTIGRSA